MAQQFKSDHYLRHLAAQNNLLAKQTKKGCCMNLCGFQVEYLN